MHDFTYTVVRIESTGYEKLPDGTYSNDKVFPKWREKYPQPPDVIGIISILLCTHTHGHTHKYVVSSI